MMSDSSMDRSTYLIYLMSLLYLLKKVLQALPFGKNTAFYFWAEEVYCKKKYKEEIRLRGCLTLQWKV